MAEETKGASFNFNTFLGDMANSIMDSVTSRMYSVNSSYISPVVGGKVTNSNQDLSKMFNLDPDIYFDFLGDYSFLNALVKAYKDPIAEVVEGDELMVQFDGGSFERIANEGIRKTGLKKYLLEHLDDFIKRGTYSGFLSVDEIDPDTKEPVTSITDSVHPFKNMFFERHGNLLRLEMNKVRFKFSEVFVYYFERKTINTLSRFEVREAKRLKDHEKDFSGIVTTSRFDRDQNPNVKPADMSKEEWEKEKAKEKLTSDIVQFRGKSIFEPFLRDLFHLFLLEYIYGQIALVEYMKSDMIKLTTTGRADTAKMTEIVNDIENLMNTDNANMICSFTDPTMMVSQIQDKLLNRFRVLPESAEYSSLSEMEVPNWDTRLERLQGDIQRRKAMITSSLSIPQEFLNEGQSSSNYRWEIISRNQHFTDALVQFLGTISNAVKQFCTAYVFRKTGKYIKADSWKHHFNSESYLYSFMQQSRVTVLSNRITELLQVVGNVDQVSGLPFINRSKFISYINTELEHIDPKLASCLRLTNDRIGTGAGMSMGPGQEEGNGQGFSRAASVPQQPIHSGNVIEAVVSPPVTTGSGAVNYPRPKVSDLAGNNYRKYMVPNR